jgi:peptidoglycan/xylan/chitin deacetylase (PgdA/CDA1 family)
VLPFSQTVAGKPHLVMPCSLTNNDGKYTVTMSHADQWYSLVKDAFDVLYKEGSKSPKMMSVGMHMGIIGHPGRAAGLWRLLDYMKKQKGVWITRRVDIANTVKTHPYRGKGLNE